MNWVSSFLHRIIKGDAPVPDSSLFSRLGGVWNNGFLFDGNANTALQVTAALCATRVIAEGVAQMPRRVKREVVKNGKTYRENAIEHPSYKLLHRKPNAWQTSFEFIESLTLHAVLCGVGRAYVTRSEEGKLLEFLPLMPEWVTRSNAHQLEPKYLISLPDGAQFEAGRTELIEIYGPSWDLIEPLNISRLARQAIGLSVDLEATAKDLAARRGLPNGTLIMDAGTSEERRKNLQRSWLKRFGPGGEGGIAVLDFDAKFQSMQMTGADAQAIENRKFQIEEVARAFRVFPQMLMHSDKTSTYASASEFFVAHVKHTLGPWVERWESALDFTLFPDEPDLYAHFETKGLMRGADKDRAEYFARALGSGGSAAWMTPDEVRALEELNPISQGNILPNGDKENAG